MPAGRSGLYVFLFAGRRHGVPLVALMGGNGVLFVGSGKLQGGLFGGSCGSQRISSCGSGWSKGVHSSAKDLNM